jgi:hypothetical protein
MKAIGGYFEVEQYESKDKPYHQSPYAFDCGRSALEAILLSTKPSKVYLPYYCCNALLQPFDKLSIPYSFYSINEALEINETITLKKKEFLVYINFFGVKDIYAKKLIKQYSKQLILDNTMAFFFKQDNASWNFNSCRKFLGIPDGSYLSAPVKIAQKILPSSTNENVDINFLFLRNEGFVQQGYTSFLKNEEAFGSSMHKMSNYSETILSSLPYKKIKEQRNENFDFWHKNLGAKNTLKMAVNKDGAMFYPFMPSKAILHEIFWAEKMFIPKLWADCASRADGFEWEKKLSKEVLPLPIDHRYNSADLKKILKLIFEHK